MGISYEYLTEAGVMVVLFMPAMTDNLHLVDYLVLPHSMQGLIHIICRETQLVSLSFAYN